MTQKTILTKQGWEKLEKELKELKEHKRPQVLERLKRARSLGDLKENSEYISAREDLNLIEQRIEEIEEILKKAEIVEKKSLEKDTVQVGSKVKVEIEGRIEEYTIVGEFEGDPLNKRISCNSPLGKALLEKKVNQTVEVLTPAGKLKYRIVAIE